MDNVEGSPESAALFLQGIVQLRPPPPFDFENPSSQPTWLLQYEDYSFTTGLYATPTDVQVRSMLYCMGPQARVVLASTTLGEADLKNVAAMKEVFTNHFVHPMNKPQESTRFHLRKQQPGETAEAFFTALRTMVKRCNYHQTDVEQRLNQDRFLVGLLDSKLLDQLCRNPQMMLHEVLKHVRQHEDADNERKARDSVDQSLLVVDAARLRKGEPAPTDKPTELCPFCGRASHPCADCPARGLVVVPRSREATGSAWISLA